MGLFFFFKDRFSYWGTKHPIMFYITCQFLCLKYLETWRDMQKLKQNIVFQCLYYV